MSGPADDSPVFVVALAAAGAGTGAGGKAAGLARLCAAGLPVPPGFALTGAAFQTVTGAAEAPTLDEVGATLAVWGHAAEEHPVPAALEADVVARARSLGGAVIVRSSMALEDGAGGAAPGVGRSIAGVAPDDVWAAVRAVWVASLTPLVMLYARARAGQAHTAGDAAGDADAGLAAPGVVVQRLLGGARTTVYTRPPGRPTADEVWLDVGDGPPRRTDRADADPVVALALAAERAIEAGTGADVELVAGDDGTWWIVQARPLVHPPPRPRRLPPPPLVLAPLRTPVRAWRRDVTHNPDPLSAAQAGLCERVERAAVAPFHLAVVAGFLYAAPRAGTPAVPAPRTAGELEARYGASAAVVDRALAGADVTLAGALAAYVEAYRELVADIGPTIAAARAVLVERLIAGGADRRRAERQAAELAPRRPSSLVAAVAAVARGELDRAALLALTGDLSPLWDVASPTFAETPLLLDDAVERARARPLPIFEAPVPAELAAEVALARAAADLAERDDLLFARAQATVRRALLATARRLDLAATDVFWLPLDELVAAEPGDEAWRARAAGRAAAARSASARAAAWDMPLVVDGRADGGSAMPPVESWLGAGVGAHVTGPAARVDQLGQAARVPRGAVVVARAVTPAVALLVEGAAAIVCEHGSLLDHGAAMARELGVPCVVGCAGITDAVMDGEWLEVDGDGGRVARVS